jgi:hypothetical protein
MCSFSSMLFPKQKKTMRKSYALKDVLYKLYDNKISFPNTDL